MAFTIGDLFVNLRANLTQFRTDMQQATAVSNAESSRMSTHFRQQTHEANEAAELLSEGIGVRIPRSIRRLIAESSLIGPALSAAFGIGAVVGIVGLIEDLAPKIKAGASELGGFTKEMQKADELAHELNQKLLINFRTPQEGAARLGDVNAAIQKGSAFIEQQRALLQSNTGILDQHWAGYLKLNQAEKELGENTKLRNELLQHGIDLVTKQHEETRAANEALSLAGKTGPERNTQEIANLEARRALEHDAHKVAILDTEIETLRIQGRADAIEKGTQAAQKFYDSLRSNSKTIADLFGQAQQKSADPFTSIAAGAEEQTRKVTAALAEIEAAAARSPRTAARYLGEIVEARFNAARAEVTIERNKNAEIDQLGSAEAAQKITAELRKQADIIPTLALPITQIPILNPEFLNAGRQQIRAATADITTLRDTTLEYMASVMTPQQQYAVTLEVLNRAYEKQLISLSQLNNLAKQTSPIFQQIRQGAQQMGQAITNSLTAVITRSGSARDALAGLLQSIAQIIAQMALAKAESAAVGILGKILGSVFGSFGGGGAGFGSTVGQNIPSYGFGIGSDVHPFAQGGSFTAGQTLLVGEEGPEVMRLGVGGSITPASELGGDTIYIDARGTDASVIARIERAIAASEVRSVNKAVVAVRENDLRRA